jgi:hypothetical protein
MTFLHDPFILLIYHNDLASVIIDFVDTELNLFVSYFISNEAPVLLVFVGIYLPLK